jgi:hypothetical protein
MDDLHDDDSADPLAPARGIVIGLGIVFVFWIVLGLFGLWISR